MNSDSVHAVPAFTQSIIQVVFVLRLDDADFKHIWLFLKTKKPSLKYAQSNLDSTITNVVNHVNVGNLRPQGIRIRKRI